MLFDHFVLSGLGLTDPSVVDRLVAWQAASSHAAPQIIFIGTAIPVPSITGYTWFAYRVFRGKSTALSYG